METDNRRNFLKKISLATVAVTGVPSMLEPNAFGKDTLLVNSNLSPNLNNESITKVHLMFKTHLDIGFTGSALKITKNLWDWKLPTEIATARALENEGIKPVFLYGSWVVWHALENSKGQKLANLEKAIEDNIITWGGTPFSCQTEAYNLALFNAMLGISKNLDSRFGKTTIAAKATDVPGNTIAIVPLLAKAGIRFLHVGVNWACPVPEVPPAFVWRHSDGSEIVVMQQAGYGSPNTITGHNQCLGLYIKGDNMDPWTTVEVKDCFNSMKQQYTRATIQSATLNEYAATIDEIKSKLPVVTSEIGDSWFYGFGSDPAKMNAFRELSRKYENWLKTGKATENQLMKFAVNLSLVGEHTWGLDHDTYLADYTNIRREKFEKLINRSNFKMMEASWNEQREYIDDAINCLPEQLIGEANQSILNLKPLRTDISKYKEVSNNQDFETDFFKFKFDNTGAICLLITKSDNKQWFGQEHQLGLYQYQTFSGTDLYGYEAKYFTGMAGLKERYDQIDAMGAIGKFWQPKLQKLYSKNAGNLHLFVAQVSLESDANKKFGAPSEIFIEYEFSKLTPEINIRLKWFNKPANRFKEASWFSMIPQCETDSKWLFEKIGSMIAPTDVVLNGGRNLHGVWEKIVCKGTKNIQIETLDSLLVSPEKPAVYDFHNQLPDMKGGVHFCLHNNLWLTNFRAWYNDDALFRFKITF